MALDVNDAYILAVIMPTNTHSSVIHITAK